VTVCGQTYLNSGAKRTAIGQVIEVMPWPTTGSGCVPDWHAGLKWPNCVRRDTLRWGWSCPSGHVTAALRPRGASWAAAPWDARARALVPLDPQSPHDFKQAGVVG
jgi:hypothetical protein